MARHEINASDVYTLSQLVVSSLIKKIDDHGFRRDCNKIKHQGFPLRYQKARYMPPEGNLYRHIDWIDPTSPFGYAVVSEKGEGSLADSSIHIDVMGYDKRNALINNIIISNVDGFGLDDDDPLGEIVRDLAKKQEDQLLESHKAHKDKLQALRIRHGPHDPRYKKALGEIPTPNNVMDIARNEMSLIFLHLDFMKHPLELIGIDLENRTMNFGVELGTGGPGNMCRYFGILEIGKNPRWDNDHCMMLSMYAKAQKSSRVLHPHLLHKGDYRKNLDPSDFVRFLTETIVQLNKSQEFFEQYSIGVAAHYKKMFPKVSVPVRLTRP